MHNYKQIKLTSGEEIICDVISVNKPDNEIVIKDALGIYKVTDDEGDRHYSFYPWMSYQETYDHTIILNSVQIMSYTQPDKLFFKRYKKALIDSEKNYEKRKLLNKDIEEMDKFESGKISWKDLQINHFYDSDTNEVPRDKLDIH